ncbi:MAG: glycosyltransferase family 2 protein [Desulfobacterales bacterium]|nr:glycosyltransferase family 2 protein [Desulfobacterales bacterium]
MLALKGNVHHRFAIDILYDLQRRGTKVPSDFKPLDLIRLTGRYGNVYTPRISELEKIAHKVAELEKIARRVAEFERHNRELERHIHQQKETICSLEEQICSIYDSRSWRLTKPVRWLAKKLKDLKDTNPRLLSSVPKKNRFPLVSVVLCIEKGCEEELVEITLESILLQTYSDWQLVVFYKGSMDEDIFSLVRSFAEENKQVRLVENEFQKESASIKDQILDHVAGNFSLFLSAGDKLNETAIDRFTDQINITPEAKIIYSDEACFEKTGTITKKHYKPDWNSDLFLSTPYFENGVLVHTDLLKQAGGLDDSFGPSVSYEALLRCTEIIDQSHIYHIPEILYLRPVSSFDRQSKAPSRQDQDIRALRSALKRRNIEADVTLGEAPLVYRIRYQLPDNPPRVTIIILTRNYYDLLYRCIESILKKTSYPNYEILIVDNNSDEQNVLDYMKALVREKKARVIRDDRSFNFSALNNSAILQAHGKLIAMLNNDTEVIKEDWLDEMVSHALKPGVGAVGARLWYPDNTLQHGGVIFVKGIAGHAHRFLPRGKSGYFGRAAAVQNFSAVTAACLVMQKDIFEKIGGMNEKELSVAYNDIDLCLRLTEAGYRIVWTPYAELYHYESASRGNDRQKQHRKRAVRELKYMIKNWGAVLSHDPAYNKNLPQDREDFFPEGFSISAK